MIIELWPKSFPKQTTNTVSGLMMKFMGKDLESDFPTIQIMQLKPQQEMIYTRSRGKFGAEFRLEFRCLMYFLALQTLSAALVLNCAETTPKTAIRTM